MTHTDKPSDDPTAEARQAAAEILQSQMRALNAGAIACLKVWEGAHDDRSSDEALDLDYYFRCAIELSETAAKTGEALARLKGDTLHNIRVERLAAPLVPARIEETLSARRSLKTKKNSKSDAKIEGGGG